MHYINLKKLVVVRGLKDSRLCHFPAEKNVECVPNCDSPKSGRHYTRLRASNGQRTRRYFSYHAVMVVCGHWMEDLYETRVDAYVR